MSTTELVALITGLCLAIAGPLALYVKSSLTRVEAAADKTVASNEKLGDRIIAAIDRQTVGYSTIDGRLARIEARMRIPADEVELGPPGLSLVGKGHQ